MKNIVECKTTDKINNTEKNKAWNVIAAAFNQASTSKNIVKETESCVCQHQDTKSLNTRSSKESCSRTEENDWSNYTPKKLKTPVSKKLRPVVPAQYQLQYLSFKLPKLNDEIYK